MVISLRTARDGSQDMTDGIEEEELAGDRSLDKHDDAGGDDREQADDIHYADAIEDDVTWASQGFGRETHVEPE